MTKKIAVLLADDFEDSEFTEPVAALKDSGHEITIIGRKSRTMLKGKQGEAGAMTHASVADCDPQAFDALLIPGGKSPGQLREDDQMVAFTRNMVARGKPVGAICHGPELLIEAGVVSRKRMTAHEEVRSELADAGAEVVDEAVVVDMPFITSRHPGDLDAFSAALVERF